MVIFISSVSTHSTRTSPHLYVNNKQKHPNKKLPVPQQLITHVDHLPAKQHPHTKTQPAPRGAKAAQQLPISGRIPLIIPALLNPPVLQNPHFLLPASRRSCSSGYFGEEKKGQECGFWGSLEAKSGSVSLWTRPLIERRSLAELIQNHHICLWVRSPQTSAPPCDGPAR